MYVTHLERFEGKWSDVCKDLPSEVSVYDRKYFREISKKWIFSLNLFTSPFWVILWGEPSRFMATHQCVLELLRTLTIWHTLITISVHFSARIFNLSIFAEKATEVSVSETHLGTVVFRTYSIRKKYPTSSKNNIFALSLASESTRVVKLNILLAA